MNRLLAIPAVCCFVAYAGLSAAMRGPAIDQGPAARHGLPSLSRVDSGQGNSGAQPSDCNALLSVEDAQELMTSLAGEYQRPWRQWQSSPRRLYSRAAPRPVPSISADIQWASAAANPSDRLLLATIAIRAGVVSQSVPCVLDRTTSQASFFSDGQWLTAYEWLKRAPLP